MRYFKTIVFVFAVLLGMGLATDAFANKSAVTIEAPDSAAVGSEVIIKINVTHSANNFMHYTNWVYVMVNGEEVERWEFSWNKKPSAETFTKEIKYKVTGPLEIKTEAHCNIHGSTGPATKTIAAQ